MLIFPQLLVHTMHKYVIEIVIKPEDSPATSVRFPETTFIAVTFYQNNAVSTCYMYHINACINSSISLLK